jgi:hypothetical protein
MDIVTLSLSVTIERRKGHIMERGTVRENTDHKRRKHHMHTGYGSLIEH